MQLHLAKRKAGSEVARIEALAAKAEGFSGAEQVVVPGLYGALARNEALAQAILQEEIARTKPLSQVMSERIANLRGLGCRTDRPGRLGRNLCWPAIRMVRRSFRRKYNTRQLG